VLRFEVQVVDRSGQVPGHIQVGFDEGINLPRSSRQGRAYRQFLIAGIRKVDPARRMAIPKTLADQLFV
jgi:hypothetical protein